MTSSDKDGAVGEPSTAQAAGPLPPGYDFIVRGAGSSGSVVAGRLAENPDLQVLLIEAGGDEAASVLDPSLWPANRGSKRDWAFRAEPSPHLDGRSLPISMGKGLGGGSGINVMVWARGHRSDWGHFAAEAGGSDGDHGSALETYREIENWRDVPRGRRPLQLATLRKAASPTEVGRLTVSSARPTPCGAGPEDQAISEPPGNAFGVLKSAEHEAQ